MSPLHQVSPRQLVSITKLAVLGVLAALLLTLAGHHPALARPATTPVLDQAHLSHLMSLHGCSAAGLAPGVIPGSALVERGPRVEHVSFDDGWAAYTGHAPGTLLAVCATAR